MEKFNLGISLYKKKNYEYFQDLEKILEEDETFREKVPKIKFESIVFGNGESTLTTEMYDDLDKIVDFLLDNPEFKLRISGHTDSDGREDFNLALSQARSESIQEYIVFFGSVDAERIIAKGFGSSRPILTDHSDRAKKLNRRVEFELYRE